jgi:hypothetical protein
MFDDEFNFLAKEINECTWNVLGVQNTMTIAFERHYECLMVGMQAHMLGEVVRFA